MPGGLGFLPLELPSPHVSWNLCQVGAGPVVSFSLLSRFFSCVPGSLFYSCLPAGMLASAPVLGTFFTAPFLHPACKPLHSLRWCDVGFLRGFPVCVPQPPTGVLFIFRVSSMSGARVSELGTRPHQMPACTQLHLTPRLALLCRCFILCPAIS